MISKILCCWSWSWMKGPRVCHIILFPLVSARKLPYKKGEEKKKRKGKGKRLQNSNQEEEWKVKVGVTKKEFQLCNLSWAIFKILETIKKHNLVRCWGPPSIVLSPLPLFRERNLSFSSDYLFILSVFKCTVTKGHLIDYFSASPQRIYWNRCHTHIYTNIIY